MQEVLTREGRGLPPLLKKTVRVPGVLEQMKTETKNRKRSGVWGDSNLYQLGIL
jgi:hypothetical protein